MRLHRKEENPEEGLYTKRDVVKSHTVTTNGVRFNVETVKDLGILQNTIDLGAQLSENRRNGHSNLHQFLYNNYTEKYLSLKVEATSLVASNPSSQNIVEAGGFFQAAFQAFARHYPLTIRPGMTLLLALFGLFYFIVFCYW
jgi:hypothetical protein